MQITLKCKHSYGMVSFPASRIEGLPIPERHYDIVNGFVTLVGYNDTVLHHDCEELLAMPNGLYRMPTPAEQEALTQQAQQASTAQENAPVVNLDGTEQGNAPLDPNEPPAMDKKQKANGG